MNNIEFKPMQNADGAQPIPGPLLNSKYFYYASIRSPSQFERVRTYVLIAMLCYAMLFLVFVFISLTCCHFIQLVDDQIQSAPMLGRLAYTMPSVESATGRTYDELSSFYVAN